MHPVRFDVPYVIERNRLTAFFRPLIAIPWLIWGAIYAIGAMIAVFIAWFALLFTTRYPQGIYDFVAGFVRFYGRLSAFLMLATDELPPFGGGEEAGYPATVSVSAPQAGYDRVRTVFKLFTYIPQYLIVGGASSLAFAGAVIAWFRIVFTGRQSITAHEAIRVGIAYSIRSTAFLALLTEAHPRLLELPAQEPPPNAPGLPAPEAR